MSDGWVIYSNRMGISRTWKTYCYDLKVMGSNPNQVEPRELWQWGDRCIMQALWWAQDPRVDSRWSSRREFIISQNQSRKKQEESGQKSSKLCWQWSIPEIRWKICGLWLLETTSMKDQFPNISLLAQLAMTSAVHTAGCEREFSVQNKILTKKRNRLNIDTQQKLMHVQLSRKKENFDFAHALEIWKKEKPRRIYEHKVW